MTRVGEPTFEVPQVGGGGFYPSALDKGTRAERALNVALAEMSVQGVSTRKVITVLQALLGPEVAISSTQVSRAAEGQCFIPGEAEAFCYHRCPQRQDRRPVDGDHVWHSHRLALRRAAMP